MTSVPLIDLAPWWSGDEADRAAVARALDEAAANVGFFQVIGHRVPSELVAATRDVTSTYFDLPEADKLAHRPPSAEINRGFAPRSSESLAYSLGDVSGGAPPAPDLFEAFNVGEEGWSPDDRAYASRAHDLFAANIWPAEPAAFRSTVLDYFAVVAAFARSFSEVVATALDLPADALADKVDHSTNLLRIVDYRTAADDPDPLAGQVGMGAHTDYGLYTTLYADAVPGLQVLGPGGAWVDVIAEPGAFVMNIGDLLAQWTNDRWRSTLHRVLPPSRPASEVNRRRSMAFFFDGNWDALIEPLPTCVSAENPARYAPVLAGEHLMAKLLGPRTLTVSKATSTLGDDRAGFAGR